jgi:hypothetical protein
MAQAVPRQSCPAGLLVHMRCVGDEVVHRQLLTKLR